MATNTSFWIVLTLHLFVAPLLVTSSRQPRQATVGAQLKSLLDEEKVLRESLEARVRNLRAKATALKSTIKPCSCPAIGQSQASNQSVAFTSTLHSTLSSLVAQKRYAFPNAITNIGGAYNATNGTFVAPVSGLYALSLTIYMPVRYYVGMDLMKEGQHVARVRTGHYYRSSPRLDRQMNMGTNFAVVNMTAGERVWIEYAGYGNALLYAEDVTTVTGYLLHQY